MYLTLDKENTLCNVGNSILKHFNVPTFHQSYTKLDEVLSKSNKQKVCLVLFDACGKDIIEKYKDDIPYIYSHIYSEIKSTYPPTTVAATTTLTTGKYPLETGYLGWAEYFKEYDDVINVFPSKSRLKRWKKYSPTITESLLKVDKIWDLINKVNNKDIASYIPSFNYVNVNSSLFDNLHNFFIATDEELKNKQFIYAYCTEPDHAMHEEGVISDNVKNLLIFLESELKVLVENNKDTLFILLADHGMIDVKQYNIKKHKDLLRTLNKPYYSIEPRFATFFVKDNKGFEKYYNENLKDYFILKTKQEVIDEHTFGYGEEHPLFRSLLGDYFLIGNKEYMIADKYTDTLFLGNHAGIKKEETEIYLAVFNN